MTYQFKKVGTQLLLLITPLIAIGCGSSDERLADYAQRSVQQQAQQNEHMARQTETVAKQSQTLAETAHKMVEADARARQELIAAQRELNGELQDERGSLDQQRLDMEQERRQIADTRNRDPIVAAAIQTTGLVIACLLPLLVCAYALRQLSRSHQDEGDGLSELLVQELVAKDSMLLEVQPPPSLLPDNKSAPLLPRAGE